MKDLLHNNESGFTLVEMLLVLFLFTIILVACSDIFLRTQRAQYQAAGLQRLQDDLRYVVNKVTQEIHSGSIDYACYNGGLCGEIIPAGNATLGITNVQGRTRLYKLSGDIGANGCLNAQSSPCVLVSDDGGTTWQSITQEGISVDLAKSAFHIKPDKDPFSLDAENRYLSNEQPRVTIRLEMKAIIRGARIPPRLGTQTTVATREYKR